MNTVIMDFGEALDGITLAFRLRPDLLPWTEDEAINALIEKARLCYDLVS